MVFTRVNGYLALASNLTVNGLITFTSISLDTGLTYSSGTLTIDGATYPGLYAIDFTVNEYLSSRTTANFYFNVTDPAIYYPGGSGTQYFPFGMSNFNSTDTLISTCGGVTIRCSTTTSVKFYSTASCTLDYTQTRVNITRVST